MTNTGYAQSLYFGCENVYGSASAINQPIGLVQSVNPTESNNLIKIRTLGGTRDFSNIVPGKFEVSGSFDFYIQGGQMLRLAIGEDSASTATTDSGPRTHTGAALASACVHCMGSAASPGADAFPSFTLEFADEEDAGTLATTSNLKRLFTGCRVNTMSMSATVDEPLSCTVDWIAQGVTVSTAVATSVTDATTDPYVFYQGAVYCTTGTIAYDTAVDTTSKICEVNGFDFSINNNLEAVWYISGTCGPYQTKRGLKALLAKGREYDASLNLHFADKAMYQRFLGAAAATGPQNTLTSYNIVLDFVRSGTIGTKVTTDDYLRILLRDCKFNDINITGSPEDIVGQTIGVFVEAAKIWVVDTDTNYEA